MLCRSLLVQLFLIDFVKFWFFQSFSPNNSPFSLHSTSLPARKLFLIFGGDVSHNDKPQLGIPREAVLKLQPVSRCMGTGMFQRPSENGKDCDKEHPRLPGQHTPERHLPYRSATNPHLGKPELLILCCLLFLANTVNHLAGQPLHIPTIKLPTSL